MKNQITNIGLTILLSAGPLCAAGLGESAEDQQLLIQSVVDAAESAARRCDAKTAQSLVQQAYTDFAQYKKVSDEKKFEALGKIEEAARLASQAKPKQPEKKVSAADAEKERSILKTWLHNVKNIFDEKQALDLYERAKRDAAKFKHMSKEEIDRILKQIEDQVKFLAPVAKSAKKPEQEEQKKEAQKNGGLRDEDAIKKATANRAKLSSDQQVDLDWRLWGLLNSINSLNLKSIEQVLQNGANPNFVIHEKNKTYGIELQVYSIATQVIDLLMILEYKSLIKLLIKYGFNLNSKVIVTDAQHQPKESTTLLIGGIKNYLDNRCSFVNLYNFINFLLDLGADPNIPDSKGDTALHHLSTNFSQEFTVEQYRTLIKLFIDRDANINAENNNHRSALTSTIVQRFNFNFARALMEFDADPFVGRTIGKDTLSEIDDAIKHLKDLNRRPGIEGSLTARIQDLEAFKKEFLQYVKNYREKHRKEIREATTQTLPVAQLPGVITEYLFGEEEKPAQEKE